VSHSPVVDSLVAHTEGFTNDLWLIPASEHQKTGGASARVLEPVIDRHLLQCDFLSLHKVDTAFHRHLGTREKSRLPKSKQFYQEHLSGK
jgi:hypothetical protein